VPFLTGTFRARDPRPGVRGRQHSHTRIHGRRVPRKFDIVPESSPGWCLRPAGEFALLSAFVRAPSVCSRTQNSRPFITASWELRGGRAVPFLTVCIHDAARGGCYRNFRWIGTFAKASREREKEREREDGRGEGVVVRTRIFCLVHASTETRRDRGAQPQEMRSSSCDPWGTRFHHLGSVWAKESLLAI